MRIVVDTNVILSAYAFGSKRIHDVIEFVRNNHEVILPDQVVDEVLSVTERKMPRQLDAINRFVGHPGIQVVPTPKITQTPGVKVRDATDQPILNAAIAAGADIIISGDKDFAALDIDWPRIMTPGEFMAEFMRK